MAIIYIFTAIVFICILGGLMTFFKSLNWRLQEINKFSNLKTDHSLYFYIIIPALREQNVISRTLDRLNNLEYPKNKYEIIIALDEKEVKQNSQNNTKEEILKYIANKNNSLKISYVEYKGQKQKRAYQLNRALEHIYQNNENQDTFIGVYDADSYPDKNVLNYINFKYKTNKNNLVFQQSLNYLLNSVNLKNIILLGNAYYQTMWNHMFEIERFRSTNKSINKSKKPLFPPYCMGHGEFFHINVLRNINGFPEQGVADGMQIGFLLTAKGYKILPIPFDDYCESPTKINVLYKQHTFWAYGNYQFFRLNPVHNIFSISFVQNLNHFLLLLKWAFRPIFVLALIIFWPFQNILIAYLLLFGIWFYYLIILIFTKKYIINKKLFDIKFSFILYFLLPISVAFKSLGAINALAKIITANIFHKKINIFSKIER